MKCPYCNKEMKQGVIQGARQFYFTTKPKKVFLSPDTGDDVWLSENNLINPHCTAFQCKTCMKLIVEYTEDNLRE